MNSYQLTKSLLSDTFTKTMFVGVFARDELPLKNKYPSCFIVNTQNRNHVGEHWLAFFLDSDGSVDFFDSIGLQPEYYNLQKYLEKISKKKIRYTNKRVQGFFSNYCGVYCLLFLYKRSRGISFDEFINLFKNINQNDSFIKKYVKNFI